MATAPQAGGPGISPAAPVFGAPERPRSVMFAVPCYGGLVHDATLHGLMNAQAVFARMGIGFGYVTTRNESLVQRARNTCVAHFLASDSTHLMFVDSDIGFTGDQVVRLLAHDRPLVGGLYRKKTLERRDWVATYLPGATAPRDPRTGAIRVAAIGTGFMLIERAVITRMIEAFPQTAYAVHPHDSSGPAVQGAHALFDCWIDPVTRTYLSEDYAFCERWRVLGGEVWADPALILEHHGTACFSADPAQDFPVA